MSFYKNLLGVLLTYLIEALICLGCSDEFNVAYVQRAKLQYSICSTTTTCEVHTFKNKDKIKSCRNIFVYHFLFYICLFVAATLL